MSTPEALARVDIGVALAAAGWAVQDANAVNLRASRRVAVREFPLSTGYGFADYLLFADARAVGVVEAKKRGETLTGVETQSARYGAARGVGCDGLFGLDPHTDPSQPVEGGFLGKARTAPSDTVTLHFWSCACST